MQHLRNNFVYHPTYSLPSFTQPTAYLLSPNLQPTYYHPTYSLHSITQPTAYLLSPNLQPTYYHPTYSLPTITQPTAYILSLNLQPTFLLTLYTYSRTITRHVPIYDTPHHSQSNTNITIPHAPPHHLSTPQLPIHTLHPTYPNTPHPTYPHPPACTQVCQCGPSLWVPGVCKRGSPPC